MDIGKQQRIIQVEPEPISTPAPAEPIPVTEPAPDEVAEQAPEPADVPDG